MRGRLPERFSYANVMATIAVFLSLGGTAVAIDGSLPGQDTVGSADIINNEVQTADIRDANLTTADIRAGAVTTGKIEDGEVSSADVLNDGLTSADIDEPSLFNDNSLDASDISNASTLSGPEINEAGLTAPVPTATNAFTVGNNGVHQLYIAADNGGGVSGGGGFGGGLSFFVRCNLTGQTDGDFDVTVSTATDNSSLAVSDDDSYDDIEDWDVADNPVDLEKLLGADTDEIINLVYVEGSGFGFHRVVTGQLHILDDAPPGDTSECILAGHLIVRAPA